MFNISENHFDTIVIGAGPGGYVAAIRLAQLGKKVLCVDRKELGGTCLNVGCIPSKSLLHSSHLYSQALHDFAENGINCEKINFSLAKMQQKKQETVQKLQQGINGLFRSNGVQFIQAEASFDDPHTLILRSASLPEGGQAVTAEQIVIATGSSPISLPNLPFDETNILSSTGALALQEVPAKMVVVGGGVIGLEMASIWQRLGSEIIIMEFGAQILPSNDADIASKMEEILKKQGVKFIFNAQIQQVIDNNQANNNSSAAKKFTVTYAQKSATDSTPQQLSLFEIDKVLVAIGRKPEFSKLNLDKIGIICEKSGRIVVNNRLQTNFPHIFAIGDAVAGPMLAHKASDEAVVLADIIAGVIRENLIHYHRIPGVAYTNPELATVGYSEKELTQQGIAYEVAKFPLLANGRAQINDDTAGLVKIIYSENSHKLLGAAIIGQDAGNLIHNFALLLEFSAHTEDIIETSFAHPTVAESIKEAAMLASWNGQAIHYKANKKDKNK